MTGDRLRSIRQARRLSLKEVAGKAKISVATLSRIERQKQGLEMELFLALCRILKVSPQELLGRETANGQAVIDPLAVRIATLDHNERVQLWREMATSRREVAARIKMERIGDEVEELMAQIELVRAKMEAVRNRFRQRAPADRSRGRRARRD